MHIDLARLDFTFWDRIHQVDLYSLPSYAPRMGPGWFLGRLH